jgi:aryl-alcohol dehydrogenase-like predicted oxidoreductase
VGGRPDTLWAHCEISLRTLETDRIDLYQLHHVDSQVPLPDSVGALGQLRQEGSIAAIGLSNVTVAQLDEALAVAPIAAVQNRLSYGDPGDLPMALACAERGVAYLAYSPFGGSAGPVPQAALTVARRRGVSAHRVLLAWLRRQSPNIVPLAGSTSQTRISRTCAPLQNNAHLHEMRNVQRHHQGARLEDSEIGGQELRNVGQLQRDPVAGFDPSCHQIGCHPV